MNRDEGEGWTVAGQAPSAPPSELFLICLLPSVETLGKCYSCSNLGCLFLRPAQDLSTRDKLWNKEQEGCHHLSQCPHTFAHLHKFMRTLPREESSLHHHILHQIALHLVVFHVSFSPLDFSELTSLLGAKAQKVARETDRT